MTIITLDHNNDQNATAALAWLDQNGPKMKRRRRNVLLRELQRVSKWQVLDSRKVSVERLRPSISALVYAGTLCRMDDSTNGWRFQQSWSETIESSASGGHVSQRLWFGVPTTLWTCHLYLFLHFTRCVQFLIGHCHQCLRLSTNVDTDIEETCEMEFTWNSLVWRTFCQLHGCGGFGTDALERRWYKTQYIHASIQTQVNPIVTTAFCMATLQSLLVAMHSTQESWRFYDIMTIIVHCAFIQTLVKRPSLSWTGRRCDEE